MDFNSHVHAPTVLPPRTENADTQRRETWVVPVVGLETSENVRRSFPCCGPNRLAVFFSEKSVSVSVFRTSVSTCKILRPTYTAWTRKNHRSLLPLYVNKGSKICANKQQRYIQENSRNERIILASVCILYCLTNVLLSDV